MKNLKLLPLNLQQTLVYEDKQVFNAVHAIHSKQKNIVAIRIEHDSEVDEIMELLTASGLVCDNIIVGDGFHADTWDEKIKDFFINK